MITGLILATTLAIIGPHPAPGGYQSFCARVPQDCVADGRPTTPVEVTPAQLAELDAVNRSVNARIKGEDDYSIYGVHEFWAIPTTVGDCEDFALLKRRELIAKGWPVGALLLTSVYTDDSRWHLVLTVRTTQGDMILDNSFYWIETPKESTYYFVSRQSPTNPREWEEIAQPETPGQWKRDLSLLTLLAAALIGIATVARWLAGWTCWALDIRTPAQRKGMEAWVRERDRIAKHYRDHYDADELDKMTDTWVGALERALDAMKDDPKLAKREIEYVLDDLEERDLA
jgi:predicted transglutaminase-like cysteine proteinase